MPVWAMPPNLLCFSLRYVLLTYASSGAGLKSAPPSSGNTPGWKKMKRNISQLGLAAALALSGRTALTQTYTWTGAVNNIWDTTIANWGGSGST